MHRDLVRSSVFIDDRGYIKVGGFGSARKFRVDETVTSKVGRTGYMAPEMLAGGPYNASVDWWNVGILIYEMLFGISPFHGWTEANFKSRDIASAVAPPKKSTGIEHSEAMMDLIKQLLTKDGTTRLGAQND